MLKRDNFMLSMENSKDVIIIRSGIMIGEMEKKVYIIFCIFINK